MKKLTVKTSLMVGMTILCAETFSNQLLAQEPPCPEGQVLGVKSNTCINISGECGRDCTYTIDEAGNMEMFGNNGVILHNSGAPFGDAVNLKVNEGIVEFGSYIYGYNTYPDTISLPQSLNKVGYYSLGATEPIILPENVTSFYLGGGTVQTSWLGYHGSMVVYCTAAQMQYCGNNAIRYEKDEEGNFITYNSDGSIQKIFASWNDFNDMKIISGTYEQKDENGNVIAKYKGDGSLTERYAYGSDGSISTYNANGKLINVQGKRILSIDEATALVSGNAKNTFTLKYR